MGPVDGRKHLQNRAQVGVGGLRERVAERSRDAEKGSGASQRAKWGPPPEKGRRGGHSQEEFDGASAVQSAHGRERQRFPSPITSFALRERR